MKLGAIIHSRVTAAPGFRDLPYNLCHMTGNCRQYFVCQPCEYLVYCSGDCLKHRLYQGAEPETLSWLGEGWKRFFAYSLPEFKKIGGVYYRTPP